MRYIIIPLAIILFIVWSYYSIKNIIRAGSNQYDYISPSTTLYLCIITSATLAFLIVFSTNHW